VNSRSHFTQRYNAIATAPVAFLGLFAFLSNTARRTVLLWGHPTSILHVGRVLSIALFPPFHLDIFHLASLIVGMFSGTY